MRRIVGGLLIVLLLLALLPPFGAWLFGWGDNRDALPPRGTAVALGDGLEVNVRDVGSGSPIVLVHGLPSNATDWAQLPAKLAALGHRVVAYDRIGYGYSSHPEPGPDRYTYASNARDLASLLERLGIDRATLVGWSYGGPIVQILAQQAPQRVARLVLLSAVGPAWPKDQRNALDSLIASPVGPALLAWVSSVPPLGLHLVHDTLSAAFGSADAIPPGWTEYTAAMLAIPGTFRTYSAEERLANPWSLTPETITQPALIIHGDRDGLVPFAIGEDLHRRLRNSRMVVVPGGSHMLQVTHPDLVADAIHTFATSD
jgi:non-heme chloroperoxidase